MKKLQYLIGALALFFAVFVGGISANATNVMQLPPQQNKSSETKKNSDSRVMTLPNQQSIYDSQSDTLAEQLKSYSEEEIEAWGLLMLDAFWGERQIATSAKINPNQCYKNSISAYPSKDTIEEAWQDPEILCLPNASVHPSSVAIFDNRIRDLKSQTVSVHGKRKTLAPYHPSNLFEGKNPDTLEFTPNPNGGIVTYEFESVQGEKATQYKAYRYSENPYCFDFILTEPFLSIPSPEQFNPIFDKCDDVKIREVRRQKAQTEYDTYVNYRADIERKSKTNKTYSKLKNEQKAQEYKMEKVS